jgi:hypothetical protein
VSAIVAGKAFRDDFSRLPRARLERMRRAADDIVAVLNETAARKTHIITELIGAATFTIGEHYPPDDVYDRGTGAGFYYHAHHADPRAYPGGFRFIPEHGHFHLLMNRRAIPPGFKPLKRPGRPVKDWGPCHIVAIVIDESGAPCRMFTLNQWLSQEWLYPAPVLIDLLDRFALSDPALRTPVNRWVVAMVALFQPQIAHLLKRRDRAFASWPIGPGAKTIFDDETLEIPSMLDIDLDRQIAAVDRAWRA